MKLQHTPGPWKWEKDFEDAVDMNRLVNFESITVLMPVGGVPSSLGIRTSGQSNGTPGNITTEGEANASLIAAAPDMLEALLKTRAYLLTVDCVFMDPEGSAGQMLVAEIDGVIERATGLTIGEVLEHE